MRYVVEVRVPMPGNPLPLTLARCQTADAAAELVRALVRVRRPEEGPIELHLCPYLGDDQAGKDGVQ